MDQIRLIENLSEASKSLLMKGIKLIGPVAGAYIGSTSNDLQSTLIGAALGDAITSSINDFAERTLSEKEKSNISITEAFALTKIFKNTEQNLEVNENLFENDISGNAREMFNGVLIASKNNYEDKKLEILGNFYGNIIFVNFLEPYFFHMLLSHLNTLNYKQLCILSILGKHETLCHSFKPNNELRNNEKWYETYIIQNELSNLLSNGLLQPYGTAMLMPVSERSLDNCRLSTLGKLLFDLADLECIDQEELDDILNKFR